MIIIDIYNPHENENEILMIRIPNHITNRETKRNQIMMIMKKNSSGKKEVEKTIKQEYSDEIKSWRGGQLREDSANQSAMGKIHRGFATRPCTRGFTINIFSLYCMYHNTLFYYYYYYLFLMASHIYIFCIFSFPFFKL